MQLQIFSPSVQHPRLSRNVKKRKTAPTTAGSPELFTPWNEQINNEKEMALLFLDIRDFTTLTGSVEASAVVHLMKKLIPVFQRVVRNYHGRIIETTGDGFYAAFGFDGTLAAAVNEAMNASQSILRYLDMMNKSSFEKDLHRRIEVGMGIHAGKVATGSITLDGTERLIVMGHAVNIASRLQAATKTLNNNIIISDDAFKLLADSTAHSDTVAINLRGTSDSFNVHLAGKDYLLIY